MQIWLDTTDTDTINKALRYGVLRGVTTNPSIIAQTGKALEDILDQLLEVQPGPIAVQVTADFTAGQVAQANRLANVSSRIIVKIPATSEGLQTIHELSHNHIPTMATAVFHARQVMAAAMAGANYIAPYVRWMDDFAGVDAFATLKLMQSLLTTNGWNAKILAAALRTTDDIVSCAQMGIAAATLKPALFESFIANHDATDHFVEVFATDWQQAKPSDLLPVLLTI